jgi:thioredoxin 1
LLLVFKTLLASGGQMNSFRLWRISVMNEPIHVSDETFEKTVLQSPIPVIVDFGAPWCGPCQMVAPVLEQIARDYAGRVIVAKVNTDDYPQWARHYGVRDIPTMLFVAHGQVVDRMVGAAPLLVIKQRLASVLTKAKVAPAPP